MKWIPEEVASKGIKHFLDQLRGMPQEQAADEYYEFALGAQEDPLYQSSEDFRGAADEMMAGAMALKNAVEAKNNADMQHAQAEAELILAKDTVLDALKESRRRLIDAYLANPETPGLKDLLDELMQKEKVQGRFNKDDWDGYFNA